MMRHCTRGICAAEEGHEGTCAEASGWVDIDETPPPSGHSCTDCGAALTPPP